MKHRPVPDDLHDALRAVPDALHAWYHLGSGHRVAWQRWIDDGDDDRRAERIAAAVARLQAG